MEIDIPQNNPSINNPSPTEIPQPPMAVPKKWNPKLVIGIIVAILLVVIGAASIVAMVLWGRNRATISI